MNKFFILVGPSGSGKTYLINRLLAAYPALFKLVRSTTTRPWREPNDDLHYKIISREEFGELIKNEEFLEHDAYLDNLYGLEKRELYRVLQERHGVMALTPRGAMAVQDRAGDVMAIVVLVAASESVLRKNLKRRGVDNPEAVSIKIRLADEFVLPQERYQYTIEMRGDDTDFPRFEEIVLRELASSSLA